MTKMSNLNLLNAFLTERLTSVTVEICGEVEKTITVYKEEISRSKEEIDRLRRLLQIVTQPKIKLHRTGDALQVTVPISEEVAPVNHQYYKQDTEPIQIKEEPKELLTNQEEEKCQGLNSNTCILKSSHPYVNTDWGQANSCKCPQLNHIQTRETREEDLISASQTKEIKPEPDTGIYRLSTPCDSLPLNVTPYSSAGAFPKCQVIDMAEKPYQCNDCGKFLKRKRSLIVHRMSHAGEKPFSCPICHKGFVALGTLKTHLKLHTGERPHRCFVCGRCFKLKGALTEHMRIHTGEKPFHCQDCGKCFSRTNALTNHMLQIHKKRRT